MKKIKVNDVGFITKTTDDFDKNEILKVVEVHEDKKHLTVIGDMGGNKVINRTEFKFLINELDFDMKIPAGNNEVWIGHLNIGEVAVASRMTGDFVQMKNVKDSKVFKRVRRELKSNLNSDKTFTFSHMQTRQVAQLVKILKKL